MKVSEFEGRIERRQAQVEETPWPDYRFHPFLFLRRLRASQLMQAALKCACGEPNNTALGAACRACKLAEKSKTPRSKKREAH